MTGLYSPDTQEGVCDPDPMFVMVVCPSVLVHVVDQQGWRYTWSSSLLSGYMPDWNMDNGGKLWAGGGCLSWLVFTGEGKY